jgi:ferredoxin-NADP reductase
MDRTANLERSEISSDAIVTDIFQLSPTVKRFQLQVLNKHVTFKAGQWVDVTIPSVSIVGGYSMCSTPLTLQTEGVLELAVKYSDHPPAKWMHSHCSVSDCLHLRVGGDFTYSPQPGSTASNLFLVAGGVGINPLLAMLKHHMELWSADHWNNTLPAIPKVCLLYSAREEGELLFKSQIDDLLHSHGDVLLVKYFVTKEKPEMRSNTLQAGMVGVAGEVRLREHTERKFLTVTVKFIGA